MRWFMVISIFLLTISCNNDDLDTNTVIGTWEINARLVDPGDGSGAFQPLSSGKQLVFDENGTVMISRGTLCDLVNDENASQTGTYSHESSLVTIICEVFSADSSVRYELKDDNLFIYYPCFEACVERYRKIAD
ncbi:hypothetical protein [Spongiivirga citrea]|uniref:Lipocalin-like domain-containing protein n=1 Tax=Spongiivirga citrea TaxID=1481457 RepID=A0A6M0CGS2_9FLAO|nr:hypothetical protein [Spongiivirga citrea]NER16133.1 hypothetical protein [Spongiivirga citrea]